MGYVDLNSSDNQIGAIELKDGTTDGRAEINAANTARTTATKVLTVQQVAADGTVDKLTTLQNLVGGGVAANAADSGNPVKVGGKYTAAGVTLDDGDRGDLALDASSNLLVSQATAIAGEDLTNDVLKVENRYSYSYLAADGQVKAGAGFLHAITISPTDAAATAGSIIAYDSLTEADPKIFNFYVPAAAMVPVTVILDVSFATGLYIGFTTTADVSVTVSYR